MFITRSLTKNSNLLLVLFIKSHRRNAHSIAASRTHSHLIKSGAATDIYSWNSILTSYGKTRNLNDAQKLFDEIPLPDPVSWNAMISSHVAHRSYNAVWDLFRCMIRRKIEFDTYTLGSVLKSIACVGELSFAWQLQCLLIKTGFDGDVYCGTALVDVYSKCWKMKDADMIFRQLPVRNVVSWNTMITGFVGIDDFDRALATFRWMEKEGLISPDEGTFSSMLSLVDLVTQLHAKIVKHGWEVDTVVCNAMITAYSSHHGSSIKDIVKMFDEMTESIRNLVTWNSMLAAFASVGEIDSAISLFINMTKLSGIEPDMYTFTSAISSCFDNSTSNLNSRFSQGKALHGLVIQKGFDSTVPVSNSLITMYVKKAGAAGNTNSNGGLSMDDAVRCFDSMETKDSVTWNSMLTGLSQSGFSEKAMKFFRRMHRSSQIKTDHFAFSAALRSCSDLAVLDLGTQVHSSLVKSGFGSNEFVTSSLIYMYSKSGVLLLSRRAFDESTKSTSVTWNSIIFAYAQHGKGRLSLEIFSTMSRVGIKPDHITFVGILSACSHGGLIKEGTEILKTIDKVHGISLRMEHYACGVDLFGRAGRIDLAMDLIKSMPFKPDSMVWMTLLGACRIHGEVELANVVARRLLSSVPDEHSTYVVLSGIYSGLKMWEGKALVQKIMRDRGVCKVPGWSWIEIDNQVHSFNAGDRSHRRSDSIYSILDELMDEIRRRKRKINIS